jgi:oligopeptide transport system ATP-binding protein
VFYKKKDSAKWKMEEKALENNVLLKVNKLKKYFPVKGGIFSKTIGYVKAVDEVSFDIKKGETLGLVGESGCGKTTTGRTIIRLLEPTSGEVFFEGDDFFRFSDERLRKARRDVQIIFQDPYGSLNPRMTVGDIVGEALSIHNIIKNKKEKEDKVKELLETVGLSATYLRRYPHEFSGGQRQRIGIARAIVLNPKLIICDEPVSALDVSIQAQIINLLEELQEKYDLTYLFIAHDLSVVKHISDRVAVMYLGKIVELAPTADLYDSPYHPYTEALLSAVPIADPTIDRERILLEGDVPTPYNPPKGCYFHPRCKKAKPICSQKEPKLIDRGNGHFVACHFR